MFVCVAGYSDSTDSGRVSSFDPHFWLPQLLLAYLLVLQYRPYLLLQHVTPSPGSRFLYYYFYPRFDDCLEDKWEVYQNCSVLYCVGTRIVPSYMHTHMSSSCRWTRACWFRLSFFLILCFLNYGQFVCIWLVSLCFCVLFGSNCFIARLPVRLIGWKDSSPKWSVVCRVGR